jgi:hypothetical protein
MKAEEERRVMNAKLVTNITDQSVNIELLYPTLYKFSCPFSIYYFPFDSQICNMTFGSWTYDKTGIDYVPYADHIGTSNFLENEGWILMGSKGTVPSFLKTEQREMSSCSDVQPETEWRLEKG